MKEPLVKIIGTNHKDFDLAQFTAFAKTVSEINDKITEIRKSGFQNIEVVVLSAECQL